MKEIESLIAQQRGFAPVHYHYAPRVHPALWGNQFEYSSGSWEHWAADTIRSIQNSPKNAAHIICTDAVGSPWVEALDFSVFNALSESEQVWLIVDESHTLGVCGDAGSGLTRMFRADLPVQLIMISSINKAMGIPGGMIAGSRQTIEFLRRSPFFAGASPPPPSYASALLQMLQNGTYVAAHEKLLANVAYFTRSLPARNRLVSTPAYPVFCSADARLFDYLLENRIMASCFSYPLATDLPVTRLVVSALHQKEDLDRLAEVCTNFETDFDVLV